MKGEEVPTDMTDEEWEAFSDNEVKKHLKKNKGLKQKWEALDAHYANKKRN